MTVCLTEGANGARSVTAANTHGILTRHRHSVRHASDKLGWKRIYASHQLEQPFSDRFEPNAYHLLVFHLDGAIQLRRRLSGMSEQDSIPHRGVFYLPAAQDLFVSVQAPIETLHIYIEHALVLQAAQELCVDDPDKLVFVPRLGTRDLVIEQLGRMVHTMLIEGQTDYFAEGVARLIASQLVREHSNARTRPSHHPGQLTARQLAAVNELIQDRMEDSLSVSDLAAAAALSPEHFARLFRRSTGLAPHQYLIEARLQCATEMLGGDASLADIACRCGFTHQEHMTRHFTRKLGISPGAYRKSLPQVRSDTVRH